MTWYSNISFSTYIATHVLHNLFPFLFFGGNSLCNWVSILFIKIDEINNDKF